MVRRKKTVLLICALSASFFLAAMAPRVFAQQANAAISADHTGVVPSRPTAPSHPTPPRSPDTTLSKAKAASPSYAKSPQTTGNQLRQLAESQLEKANAKSNAFHDNQNKTAARNDGKVGKVSSDARPAGVSGSLYAGESERHLGDGQAAGTGHTKTGGPGGRGGSGNPGGAGVPKIGSGSFTGGWVLDTLTALGLVIGLILLLRWGWARMGGRVIANHSPAVEVLSRTAVAPKNHVLLLRVGQRLLVVGDSSAGLRTLSQIDEPQEVADLLMAVTSQKDQSISKNFTQLLSRFNGDYDKPRLADEGGDDSEVVFDRTRDRISGLANRIRTFAQRDRAG